MGTDYFLVNQGKFDTYWRGERVINEQTNTKLRGTNAPAVEDLLRSTAAVGQEKGEILAGYGKRA